jgi:tRNA (guanine10-N2)-dimethyltransferase|tara:strand:+ start:2222 stop:3358 length:1137 start_codon:yes stop_codon:yes gene_type:complete
MSQSLLLGSGWHPPLFRSEIDALFGNLNPLHPRIVLLDEPIDDNFLSRVSRAALVDDLIHFGGYSYDSDFDLISNEISNWCKENLPSGSFAVRSKKLGSGVESISRRDLEKDVGARLFSEINPVNLHNPEHEIVIILAGEVEGEVHRDFFDFDPCIIWGIRENKWDKTNYLGRQPMERPFFKPISLEPRLAKLLISLAHRKGISPENFIDPFCGTGGIAIEALLQGMEIFASDLDPTMVYGIKKNLSWANDSDDSIIKVEKCSVKNIAGLWGEKENCIFVFDPPYGRNAWKSDDGLELFLSALEQALKIDSKSVISTMLPAGSESLENDPDADYIVMGRPWSEIEREINERGWQVHLRTPVKVHKSLARMVVVCHPLH